MLKAFSRVKSLLRIEKCVNPMRDKSKSNAKGNGAKLRNHFLLLENMQITGLRRQEIPTMRTRKGGLRPTRITIRTKEKA